MTTDRMTTTTDPTALLAEALTGDGVYDLLDRFVHGEGDVLRGDIAATILAASPDLRRALAIGLAGENGGDARRDYTLESLREWQNYAGTLSDALLEMGHHNTARHQAPEQYDAESGLACAIPACLTALADALRKERGA